MQILNRTIDHIPNDEFQDMLSQLSAKFDVIKEFTDLSFRKDKSSEFYNGMIYMYAAMVRVTSDPNASKYVIDQLCRFIGNSAALIYAEKKAEMQ